jgi:hypothetical protein
MSTVLIAGVPRSGTTWVGEALGHTAGTVYVNEPDGDHDPFAFRARRGQLVAPALRPGAAAPDYKMLWAGAFAGGQYAGNRRDRAARSLYARIPIAQRWEAWLGGRESARLRLVSKLAVPRVAAPDARHVVVKSVRAELALEWIVEQFRPMVVIVERHPLNVLASWIELDFVRDPREAAAVAGYARDRWGIEPPRSGDPQLVQQSYYFGVLASGLRDATARHPEWKVVSHEELCVDTHSRFRVLASGLGLDWGPAAVQYIDASNEEGHGYRTSRRTEAQPERWRERLDPEQIATIRETLARFPYPLLPD